MNYKAAIEAILFTMGESVELGRIADAIQLSENETKKLIEELKKEYAGSANIGMNIIELDGAYQMCTKPQMYEYLIRIAKQPKKRVLTDVLLETLSIIAYKQPVTKGEIEAIRGIKCDRVMEGLMGKGLVEAVGRSQAIGRPILYGTTDMFLKNFGFTSLKDLPEIEDIETAINTEDAEMAEEDKDLDQMELDIEL